MASESGRTSGLPATSDRLDSWKEIAAYLRRGISTVQRWEREEDLPVHRLAHNKLGSVYASRSEIEEWWKRRGQRLTEGKGSVPRVRSLAVLPLANLSGEPEQQYFADGMTEALISEFAQVRALKVISRTSVMQYRGTTRPIKEIAAKLSVEAILEGSVLRSGDRIRITAQLIHVASDSHIWARSYERDLCDVLKLQGEVARSVAEEIRVQLTPQEVSQLTRAKAILPAAHDACIRGRYFWNKRSEEGLRKAVECFQEAIRADRDCPLALAGLADAWNMLAGYAVVPGTEAYPKAITSAQRAIDLEPALAEAHTSLAWAQTALHFDWAAADRGFRHALQLKPSYSTACHWYAWFLAAQGRRQPALEQIERALELDPLSMVINAARGFVHFVAGDPQRGIEHLLNTLAMDASFARAHWWLGQAYLHQRKYDDALHEFEQAVRCSGNGAQYVASLGHVYAAMGRTLDARRTLEELCATAKERYVPHYDRALIYAFLGDLDRAFGDLYLAYEAREDWLTRLTLDPRTETLRSDLRFSELLRRMNLPTALGPERRETRVVTEGSI